MKLRTIYPNTAWWVVALAGTVAAICVFFLFRFLWKEWTLIALGVTVLWLMGGLGWMPKQTHLHAIFIGVATGIFFAGAEFAYLMAMSP